ncbi:hypothetical protein AGABI2DRAFT_190224, partial [Agaricus bisporus var. bisporus H97]|uniref:hypothetical protein n=1 Tax=Agaricus bisporus var. bisporus (strain H97 / ATCC MYA-4626 / FGSC 10389) TaxID=936046 RepID=UPI00029F6117
MSIPITIHKAGTSGIIIHVSAQPSYQSQTTRQALALGCQNASSNHYYHLRSWTSIYICLYCSTCAIPDIPVNEYDSHRKS